MAAVQDFLSDFESSLESAANAISLDAAPVVVSAIPVSPTVAGPGAPYPAMYVFGDSLSDTGNISLATAGLIPVSPPYEDRSFTNGQVWAQGLTSALSLPPLSPSLAGGTDFAYGGAETGSTLAHTENASDLPSQYSQFLAQVRSPQAGALYAIWIGSNDVLDIAGDSSLSTAQQQEAVATAVNNEVTVINELVAHGARNLLVLDVPDLGKTPYEMARGAEAQTASSLASLYDADLSNAMLSLAASGPAQVNLVDTFGVLDHVIANPGAYGFSNVTTPVWDGNLTDSSSGTLAATGAAQNGYLFFDPLHPTTAAHALLASGIGTLLATNVAEEQGPHTEFNIAADAGAGAVIQDTGIGTLQLAASPRQISFTDGTAVFDPTGDAAAVTRLYQVVLGRAPDAGGLENWTVQLNSHTLGLNDVALDFINSSEFSARFGTLGNQAFVAQLYQNMRGTAGDPQGVQTWNAALNAGVSRSQVALGFADSIESQNDTLSIAGDPSMAEAYRLYGVFDRTPDTAGLDNWTALLESGAAPLQVAQDFVDSTEFAGIYGGMTAQDFVDTLYQNVLHRSADPTGMQSWVGQLNAGISQAQVVLGFTDSLENRLNTSQVTHDGWGFVPSTVA
ncbi:MAG TPA: DUF4214 domain-containing protein [Acetobacteraceae bacterium]|nr:DUF4214 domain-containing protein [Acetobacteraceae bacterium]